MLVVKGDDMSHQLQHSREPQIPFFFFNILILFLIGFELQGGA
jgi:hypothetical protein